MDIGELMEKAKDTVTVKRVFGEPIEKDGVVVVPVAWVAGGGGGGEGSDGDSKGGGGGFGFHARPIGVYVISGGTVRFRPTIEFGALVGLTLGLLRILLGVRRSKKHR
jgi:uncharacterized spore protein YtfJ